MCDQKTSEDTHSAISLPESASGATPCVSQAGPTTGLCGQDPAPASLSALPDRGAVLPTNATCGPSGSISLASADLELSLVSKLKQRLGTAGSTLFNLTWKAKATPAKRLYFQLVPLMPHTAETEFGLWPTPRASEWKGTGPLGSKSHNHRLERGYLDATVQEASQESGSLNPAWVEWLMGFPIGHTDLNPSETQSFRKSLRQSRKQ